MKKHKIKTLWRLLDPDTEYNKDPFEWPEDKVSKTEAYQLASQAIYQESLDVFIVKVSTYRGYEIVEAKGYECWDKTRARRRFFLIFKDGSPVVVMKAYGILSQHRYFIISFEATKERIDRLVEKRILNVLHDWVR